MWQALLLTRPEGGDNRTAEARLTACFSPVGSKASTLVPGGGEGRAVLLRVGCNAVCMARYSRLAHSRRPGR